MIRSPLALLTCLLFLSPAYAAPKDPAEAPKPPPARKLPRPGYLSPVARQLLDERMDHHGTAVMRLGVDVVLLAYDDLKEAVEKLLAEPTIARPKEADASQLNASFPPAFYTLQDKLRAQAKKLGEVAAKRDEKKLVSAYADVVSTCVACHALYLRGPGSEQITPGPIP